MTKYPFKEGDELFHPTFGRVYFLEYAGSITNPTARADVRSPVFGRLACHLGELSYTPWPDPVLQKPLKDGFYLVKFKGFQKVYLARYSSKEQGPWALLGTELQPLADHTYRDANDGQHSHVKPLRYLGESLDNFPTL